MEDMTPRINWSNVIVHLIWGIVAIVLFTLHVYAPATLVIFPKPKLDVPSVEMQSLSEQTEA